MELLAMSVRPVKLLLNSTTTNSTLYWVGISTIAPHLSNIYLQLKGLRSLMFSRILM